MTKLTPCITSGIPKNRGLKGTKLTGNVILLKDDI